MTTSMEAEAFLTVMKASVEPGVDDPQLLLARKTVETMKGTISGLSSWLLDPEPETRPRDPKFPSPKTLNPHTCTKFLHYGNWGGSEFLDMQKASTSSRLESWTWVAVLSALSL